MPRDDRREEVAAAQGQRGGEFGGANAVDIGSGGGEEIAGQSVANERHEPGPATGFEKSESRSDEEGRGWGAADRDQSLDDVAGGRQVKRLARP